MSPQGARGVIAPNEHSYHPEIVGDLTAGRWLRPVATAVPGACIDGRRPVGSPAALSPRIAGGALGMWVGAVLAGRPGDQIPSLGDFLHRTGELGIPLGVHRAPTDGDPDMSGCGAADQLAPILEGLAAEPEYVVDLMTSVGMPGGNLDGILLERATEFAAYVRAPKSGRPLTGAKLIDTVETASHAFVADLVGVHRESSILVNLRTGHSLDYSGFGARHAGNPEVFTIDAWVFPSAGSLMQAAFPALCGRRVADALATFNAAAVLALVAPELPASNCT